MVAMVVALAVVLVRLVSLQGSGAARYDALSRRQLLHTTTLEPARGAILDRNGTDLALSVSRPTVFADPALVRRAPETARRLSTLLHRPTADLLMDLTKPGTNYVVLAKQVTPDVAKQVTALANPGVALVPGTERIAPNGSLAGPVIGFSNGPRSQGGIEYGYRRVLAGTPGTLEAERDPSGREIPATQRRMVPARAGSDVVLTIDRDLQYQVEQQLTSEVAQTKAKGGMALIADVRSGDILAAAVIDGAEGSRPARPAPATAPNRIFTSTYEPGSTNKVVVVASALERGLIDENTRFQVPGQIRMGPVTFEDDEPHGTADWTVHEILAESSNVGTIKIAATLGASLLDRSLREFGLGVRSAVGFPGESDGLLPPPSHGDTTIMGSLPIGYGVGVTAAQMLGVYMTIANGGETRPLRLVDGVIDADGTRHRERTMPSRRVVSGATASLVNVLLRGVVDHGTGEQAKVPGYTVAGKTGTARKQPYAERRYMASFAGFAPAESPRFAAIVVLDEPKTQIYGGAVAAPVFSQIMQDALRLEHVPPTVAIEDPATTGERPRTAGNVSAPAP